MYIKIKAQHWLEMGSAQVHGTDTAKKSLTQHHLLRKYLRMNEAFTIHDMHNRLERLSGNILPKILRNKSMHDNEESTSYKSSYNCYSVSTAFCS